MKNKKQYAGQLNTILFFVLFFGVFSLTRAANPELIVTWRAANFYPISYTGKAIPSYGTKIYFVVEGIQDGKLLDLSRANIEWRKNGERIRGGDGQKEAMVVFNKNDETSFVSVAVTANGTTVIKNVSVPVIEPQLILEVPYLNMTVAKNADVAITATPYFFNAQTINDFSFSWIVNGIKKGTGSNNKLILNTGSPNTDSDSIVNISGYAQNKRSLLEIKKTQTRLFISK